MSEAPERIWVKLNGIPKFYESPCDDMPLLERYVRADIHEARIKELEAQLAEVFKKISDLDAFIDRLTKSTSRR